MATVSNVLNQRLPVSQVLRERVLRAAKELAYEPDFIALSLKSRQTRTIGMVVPDITNPYFPLLIRGVESVTLPKNYLLITVNTDDNVERERNALSLLRSRKVDGVLLVAAPDAGQSSHLAGLAEGNKPTVCLDRRLSGVELDSVSCDNAGGARNCVRHLLNSGFRKIGMVSGPLTLETARQRLDGYRLALEEAGQELNSRLVVQSDFREAGGVEAANTLLTLKPRPDAVFLANGMMTIGFLHGMRKMGISCPRDIAIACFDDLPFSDTMEPSLTSVFQPAFDVGKAGAELLLDRIEGKREKTGVQAIVLQTELRIRESSSRKPSALNQDRIGVAP